MARQNDIHRKREDRSIYALVSPSDRSVWINHCKKSALLETYRHNVKGRRYASKRFFDALHALRPCLFILEDLPKSTIHEAYGHILAWIRVLMESGYRCFNYQTTIERSQDLNFKNQQKYEERKNINVQDLLSCDKCMKPTYKRVTCDRFEALIRSR